MQKPTLTVEKNTMFHAYTIQIKTIPLKFKIHQKLHCILLIQMVFEGLHQKGYKLSIAIFSKQYVIGKFSILTAR